MTISEVLRALEAVAPLQLQESYDNSGLLVGNANTEVNGILTCLDCTPAVLEEAIEKKCNLIVSHHPLIFKGLKKLTGDNPEERVIISAIRNGISIYACHTNLDNVPEGVNGMLASKIGLRDLQILQPLQGTIRRLIVFVPESHVVQVRSAMFAAGAGRIGEYDECSFNTKGEGTFRAGREAEPFAGRKGERHVEKETKVETIYPVHLEKEVLKALIESHPYEEVAYDILNLVNIHRYAGAGIIGELEKPMNALDFLTYLKERLDLSCIRHTTYSQGMISKVAVCGGSGSFLLEQAVRQAAHAFVTADFKYHQFFDPDGRLLLADIGHFESERFTAELLAQVIRKKFTNFAVHVSERMENPVKYFI